MNRALIIPSKASKEALRGALDHGLSYGLLRWGNHRATPASSPTRTDPLSGLIILDNLISYLARNRCSPEHLKTPGMQGTLMIQEMYYLS